MEVFYAGFSCSGQCRHKRNFDYMAGHIGVRLDGL